jgi:geranylgeranyl pyrophosphate synthase
MNVSVDEWRAAVDADLEHILGERGAEEDPGKLREAMRYAVLGGGKRLRPVLAFAGCVAAGGAWETARPVAAAVELLHAYTLVHDDLPAMDDDVERRGKPTVHVAFGEAIAILVGDALLTEAFAALAALGARTADAVAVLARRAGARELLAGQARDVSGHVPATLAELEVVHAGKTGALFAAATELGAIAAGADAATRERVARFGLLYGIAFQHVDDRDDGDHPELAAAAAQRLVELRQEIAALLAPLGERAAALRAMADRLLG